MVIPVFVVVGFFLKEEEGMKMKIVNFFEFVFF